MRNLATFVLVGAVLAVGLTGQAMADVVTVQCSPFDGSPPTQEVTGVQASAGVELPASCAAGSSCPQCVADLIDAPEQFKLVNSFNISQGGSFNGPYFIFTQ
jgi:hypothetical protein